MGEDYVFTLTEAEQKDIYQIIGTANEADATQIWILLCGFLVFFMHSGFAMLEAGSVRSKNAINIMFKNVGTVTIGAIAYFTFGYGFAYGEANASNGSSDFIGSGFFFMKDVGYDTKHMWFFQYAFCATGATIVSGAVAGRIKLEAYFLIALAMTIFIYPVVSHWIWATGFLSAFRPQEDRLFYSDDNQDVCGMIDYAGSGVVHMTGGVAAFWVALFLGPRTGRFETKENGKKGAANDIAGHSYALCTLGTFILWFGWYGFNCGSTLLFDGANASKVAVTTTLSPSAAAITGMILNKVLTGSYDLSSALNCVLAGLVSITAGCSVVDDWHALPIGIIGAVVYLFASKLMVFLGIDDPLDAVAVHGFCGMWGCLAVGWFAKTDNIAVAYGSVCAGNGNIYQFLTQLAGVASIIVWVSGLTIPLALALKYTIGLRVSAEHEEAGLDASEHGGKAYEIGGMA